MGGAIVTLRKSTILSLFLVPCIASAQKYPDPDSPAVQAAARADLPHAKVLTIIGVSGGMQSVLQDLKAKVTAHEVKIELDADVLFDFDKYSLRPSAADSLREVSEVAKNYGIAPVLIEGHTDGKGNDQYNQALSERRAQSVRLWLGNHGVTSRMAARGFGKTRPVAPNTQPNGADNPDGRQKNRRVEITFTTAQ